MNRALVVAEILGIAAMGSLVDLVFGSGSVTSALITGSLMGGLGLTLLPRGGKERHR